MQIPLTNAVGKTITKIVKGDYSDDLGDYRIRITFTDGSRLLIESSVDRDGCNQIDHEWEPTE